MKPQFEEQYSLFEKDWWWFAGRHDLVSKIFSHLKHEAPIKVLEVGCGSGENSKIFDSSVTYFGVDISLNAIKRGNRNNNLIGGTAEALSFPSNTFDAVLFLDVLEHLDDEKSAIDEAGRVLKDDGILLVLVPVFKFLWSQHDVLNQHRRRYTKSELIAILTNNNFSITKLSYWNFFLFPPVALMRVIKKHSKERGKSDFITLPTFFNNILLVNLLKSENYLISKGFYLPIGVSMLCICKKSNGTIYI